MKIDKPTLTVIFIFTFLFIYAIYITCIIW